jgi:hypothetical protein
MHPVPWLEYFHYTNFFIFYLDHFSDDQQQTLNSRSVSTSPLSSSPIRAPPCRPPFSPPRLPEAAPPLLAGGQPASFQSRFRFPPVPTAAAATPPPPHFNDGSLKGRRCEPTWTGIMTGESAQHRWQNESPVMLLDPAAVHCFPDSENVTQDESSSWMTASQEETGCGRSFPSHPLYSSLHVSDSGSQYNSLTRRSNYCRQDSQNSCNVDSQNRNDFDSPKSRNLNFQPSINNNENSSNFSSKKCSLNSQYSCSLSSQNKSKFSNQNSRNVSNQNSICSSQNSSNFSNQRSKQLSSQNSCNFSSQNSNSFSSQNSCNFSSQNSNSFNSQNSCNFSSQNSNSFNSLIPVTIFPQEEPAPLIEHETGETR